MNILNFFNTQNIKEVTGVNINITNKMYDRIRLWQDILHGSAFWHDKAPSCGIPEQIAGRLDMLVSREIGIDVENPAIEKVMKHLNSNVDIIVDYIALLGSCIIRPIYANDKLQYEILPLGNYFPIHYDFDGTLDSALILSSITYQKENYILTETHSYKNKIHKVESCLYRNTAGTLRKISLSSCPQTQDITPCYIWQNVKQPMIIEFRNHAVNKIDGSNVPVAVIAGAEHLIKDADEQYGRMLWEQESGEKIVFADSDMFKKRITRDGSIIKTEMTNKLKRLITMIDGDGSKDGSKITEYSPQLRTETQNTMFQQILKRIELTTNIGKGTISDMENIEQTATQYNGGRQALFAIVDKIEDEIENKYKQCSAVFAHMASAYKLGNNNSNITVNWNDDTTRKDQIQAKQMELQEVSAGIRNKWEYRMDFMKESEAQAKANVPDEPTLTSPFDFA